MIPGKNFNSEVDLSKISTDESVSYVDWFYDEVKGERFYLAFQTIKSARSNEVLYYEGLLRHCDGPMKLNPFPILEGRNCIRALDHCVVSSVVAMLRDHPEVRLGCNISAKSAVLDDKWCSIISQLKAEPALAERLVIEITESATSNHGAATEFVIHMRGLGCLLAVDDFGCGFSTFEFIRSASPDIIKIDKGYLQRARICEVSRRAFGHLVGLCSTFVPYVIVEGVEVDSDTELLHDCAAEWMQGFLIGRPQLYLSGTDQQCVVKYYKN